VTAALRNLRLSDNVNQNPDSSRVINFLDIIRRLNLYLKRSFGDFLRNVVSIDRVSPCLQRQGFARCRLGLLPEDGDRIQSLKFKMKIKMIDNAQNIRHCINIPSSLTCKPCSRSLSVLRRMRKEKEEKVEGEG
jgi:hypothetical protein